MATLHVNNHKVADAKMLDRMLKNIGLNDTDALEQLYNSCSSSVYAYALSLIKNPDEAKDVMHDAFLSIYKNANTYNSVGKPMAWILTITKNLCFMRLRELKKQASFDEDYLNNTCHILDGSAEDKILIENCINNLDEIDRQIVVLHAVSGFKHREIASFLGIPLSTVLSKYSRATAKLKNYLKEI